MFLNRTNVRDAPAPRLLVSVFHAHLERTGVFMGLRWERANRDMRAACDRQAMAAVSSERVLMSSRDRRRLELDRFARNAVRAPRRERRDHIARRRGGPAGRHA